MTPFRAREIGKEKEFKHILPDGKLLERALKPDDLGGRALHCTGSKCSGKNDFTRHQFSTTTFFYKTHLCS